MEGVVDLVSSDEENDELLVSQVSTKISPARSGSSTPPLRMASPAPTSAIVLLSDDDDEADEALAIALSLSLDETMQEVRYIYM
jgi:hypothetical protein